MSRIVLVSKTKLYVSMGTHLNDVGLRGDAVYDVAQPVQH